MVEATLYLIFYLYGLKFSLIFQICYIRNKVNFETLKEIILISGVSGLAQGRAFE